MKIVKTESPNWDNHIDTVCAFVNTHTMASGSKFALDNWECKYINFRVDMRTGNVSLYEGNTDNPKHLTFTKDIQ